MFDQRGEYKCSRCGRRHLTADGAFGCCRGKMCTKEWWYALLFRYFCLGHQNITKARVCEHLRMDGARLLPVAPAANGRWYQ